ncbi:hypothetical protein [Bacillus sp. RO1]|uniref:hypothetical protein n=1 Tax=Bacillus sp. RO1 TaxID=2722703 RepID=UPI0014568FD3|nr:hypothetical protein [Bacillus sp. RO1]NLP52864.1 hypothetical protein [Bacillus sp. RO1]
MNVRHSLILSLSLLFLLLFPTIGDAEKGTHQSEGNGKPAEKNVVDSKRGSKKEETTGNTYAEIPNNENTRANYSNAELPKADKKPEVALPHKERQSEPSNKLHAQANKKAKKVRLEKTEKSKKSNSNQPVHNKSESKKPSEVVKKEPSKKVRKEQLIVNMANKLDGRSNKSPTLSQVNNVTVKANGELPMEDLPEQFPESESPEFFISQTKPSGSNAKGQSSDQKVSSTSIFDLIAGSLEDIQVNFLQPYVMRQHIYRDQWVNAPPAPPPENALFF